MNHTKSTRLACVKCYNVTILLLIYFIVNRGFSKFQLTSCQIWHAVKWHVLLILLSYFLESYLFYLSVPKTMKHSKNNVYLIIGIIPSVLVKLDLKQGMIPKKWFFLPANNVINGTILSFVQRMEHFKILKIYIAIWCYIYCAIWQVGIQAKSFRRICITLLYYGFYWISWKFSDGSM